MFDLVHDVPGRLFVAATLLPLLAAIGLLLAGTVRRLNNPHANPTRRGGYVVLLTMIVATACAVNM